MTVQDFLNLIASHQQYANTLRGNMHFTQANSTNAERTALAQADELLQAVIQFPYNQFRIRNVDTNHQPTMPISRRASREAADRLTGMLRENFTYSNTVKSLFNLAGHHPLTLNHLAILRYIESVLLVFKTHLQLSEFRYYLSLGFDQTDATILSRPSSATPVAWIQRFDSLIGNHLNQPDFQGLGVVRYNKAIKILKGLEQAISHGLHPEDQNRPLANMDQPEPPEHHNVHQHLFHA